MCVRGGHGVHIFGHCCHGLMVLYDGNPEKKSGKMGRMYNG